MILSSIDIEYWDQDIDIIGIDEVGRGPMAGPCIVVGVVLPRYFNHPLMKDSKSLTQKQREEAYNVINTYAKQIIIKSVSVAVIDELNIYRATQEAMEWVANTSHCFALTDAMPICAPHESFIKGDSRSVSIAAASIIAGHRQSLTDWTICVCIRKSLYQLVANVASIKIWEDDYICFSSNF